MHQVVWSETLEKICYGTHSPKSRSDYVDKVMVL